MDPVTAPESPLEPAEPSRLVGALVVVGVGVLAAALAAWPGLQATHWWYPETDAYWLWVGLVVALTAASFRTTPGRALGIAWGGASALCLSGLATLLRDLWRVPSGGDLLQGALLGARRRLRGEVVYDLRGFDQSVNATPLYLVAVLPLAPLADRVAVITYAALTAAALLAHALWGSRRLAASLGLRPRLWHAALALVSLTTYGAFQRSWRLGQLDTLLVLLLGLTAAMADPDRRHGEGGSDHSPSWWGSATAAGLAAALKVLPALALLPAAVRALRGPQQRQHRRWLVVAVTVGLGATALALVALGPVEGVRFMRNLPRLSQGTASGNNYSWANRISTYGDRQLRSGRGGHRPLPASGLWLSRALALAGLLALLLALARFARARWALAAALALACLPLISPGCWDIYLLWGGALPALIGWMALLARRQAHGARPADSLLAVALGGGYLLAGTMGNTVHRDYDSGRTEQLDLPVWLDELPTIGHLLLLSVLALITATDHALRAKESPADSVGPEDRLS
jgi:hypothetical protein